jgi:hypothetical protein
MYGDEDPDLVALRPIALGLPGATQVEAWGRPTFRAGRIFAILTSHEHHPSSVLLRADDDEYPALVADPRFYLAPYFKAAPWVALDLTAAPVDWAEVAELVETSYRTVAPPKLLRELDSSR